MIVKVKIVWRLLLAAKLQLHRHSTQRSSIFVVGLNDSYLNARSEAACSGFYQRSTISWIMTSIKETLLLYKMQVPSMVPVLRTSMALSMQHTTPNNQAHYALIVDTMDISFTTAIRYTVIHQDLSTRRILLTSLPMMINKPTRWNHLVIMRHG